MAVYHVDSDSTADTSAAMATQVEELVQMLTTVDGRINTLLAEGYQTPEAERTFRPYFERYKANFGAVREDLQGISQYLRSVGETYAQTDTQLGGTLGG